VEKKLRKIFLEGEKKEYVLMNIYLEKLILSFDIFRRNDDLFSWSQSYKRNLDLKNSKLGSNYLTVLYLNSDHNNMLVP
jgi:hypothetical protein